MTAHLKALQSILLPAALLMPLLTGCQSAPASALEGHYTLQAQSVQVNGTIINIGDWPGSSVTVSAVDDEAVTVCIDSLLPGFDTLTFSATAAGDRKDRYTFTGTYSGQDRDISVTGTVKGSALSLNITDTCTSPVTGRWTVASGEDGLADITIAYSSPAVTEITVGGITLPADMAVQILQGLIREKITPVLENLQYIELDRTGYVNLSWRGDISPELEPLLSGVVQYWPDPGNSWVHIYLRRTITDGLGLPVSPIDFALAYSTDGDGTLTLEIDQDTFAPWTGLLLLAVQGGLGGDITAAGIPLEEIAASLAMPETSYSVSAALTSNLQ